MTDEGKNILSELKEVIVKRSRKFNANRQSADLLAELEINKRKIVSYVFNAAEEIQDWQPDTKAIEHARQCIEHPVFICGPMKSGTTMLLQLLDGHSNILAMPGDSRYVKHIKNGFLQGKDWKPRAEDYLLKLLVRKDGKFFFQDNLHTYRTLLLYIKHLIKNEDIDSFFCVAMALLAVNPNKSWRERCIVEKTPGNEFHVLEYLAPKFPKGKFIHLIREPMANLVSIKYNYLSRNKKFQPIGMSYYLQDSFTAAKGNLKALGKDKYHIVKYEDIVNLPEETMNKIADFLGFEFEESLLVPTENRIPCTANSSFDVRLKAGCIESFDGDEKWLSKLTCFEKICIINFLAKNDLFSDYNWSRKATKYYQLPAYNRQFVKAIGKVQQIRKIILDS